MSSIQESYAVKIFDYKWRCEGTRESLSLLNTHPKVEELTLPPIENYGYPLFNKGVTVEILNDDFQHDLDLLNNVSRYYVGDHYYAIMGATLIDCADITIASMIIIMEGGGNISLVNPEDAVEIYTIVNVYLTTIYENTNYNVHYTPPPKKDIKSLEDFRSALERVAEPYQRIGEGNSDFATILSLMCEDLRNKNPNNARLTIHGNTQKSGLVNYSKDPYDFKVRR